MMRGKICKKNKVTKNTEPVVDGDHHEVAVGGHHGPVVEVAAPPVEAVAVDEEDDWARRVLDVSCNGNIVKWDC